MFQAARACCVRHSGICKSERRSIHERRASWETLIASPAARAVGRGARPLLRVTLSSFVGGDILTFNEVNGWESRN
ncbi:hypothetical protein EMIT047CA2_130129 [Pseudomonas soli]